MFTALGLFSNQRCPHADTCSRPFCLFSHRQDAQTIPSLPIPEASSSSSSLATTSVAPKTIPAKRPLELSSHAPALESRQGTVTPSEPPRQRPKFATSQKSAAPSSNSQSTTGVPTLRVNAAQSLVAVPVRQTMLKSLYEHFKVLYASILHANPTLASEHALRQEEEVYRTSTKLTYRNAVINSIAALKRRSVPDSISHPSVGTEEEITKRAESKKEIECLKLTASLLQPLLMTSETMKKWGYITDVPDGPGSTSPHAEGEVFTCERCSLSYRVESRPSPSECTHHWGRPFTRSVNGERLRIYSCCSRTAEEGGCSVGSHVFYESKPEELHIRHAFSCTRSGESSSEGKVADVVALDCEMIYTTGGMRVARVSVVDGAGKELLDELVQMDEGVEVIDHNTRFSGITNEELAKATRTLSGVRKLLDEYITSETILIGHALENDLKTLRMIHTKCVDTAILFPHRAGPPYRRSLRDLAREHLGIKIQSGDGTIGHSSVEDSVATLDLVRWYVLYKHRGSATTTES
ncbi:ribonuclease H-like protein [Coniophora puteana RWD-64-598 SS2]|uniref:Ribonuclease H-like protein n=1 Tax=Coniophora puteana (strain RWD-64-598) TaxID=741705 RepID=A0A5M3MSH3_CONPW|nr:ribonuclease H-like protein [Coniophora puteana RWD-64-598 SS2]EIW82112.1 ribonuclease H-like protein [Coniophora puteana RWD-64-598 SS2]